MEVPQQLSTLTEKGAIPTYKKKKKKSKNKKNVHGTKVNIMLTVS